MAIGMTVGPTIDQITGEMIATKGIAIETKIAVGPGIEMKETEAVPGKVPIQEWFTKHIQKEKAE